MQSHASISTSPTTTSPKTLVTPTTLNTSKSPKSPKSPKTPETPETPETQYTHEDSPVLVMSTPSSVAKQEQNSGVPIPSPQIVVEEEVVKLEESAESMEEHLSSDKEDSSIVLSDTPEEVSSVLEEKEQSDLHQHNHQQRIEVAENPREIVPGLATPQTKEENPIPPPISPMDCMDQMNESTLPVVMSTRNSQDQLYQSSNMPSLTPLSIPAPAAVPTPTPIPTPAAIPPYGMSARDMNAAMKFARGNQVRMPPMVPSTSIRFTVITNIVNGELFLVVPSIPEEILREDIAIYNLNGVDLPGWRMMKVEGQYWSKTLTVIQRESMSNLVPPYLMRDERSRS